MSEQRVEGFDFPVIEVGEIVMFMASPSDGVSHAMVVSAVGADTIDGMVYWRDGGATPRSGVRYITDPFFQDAQQVSVMLEDQEGGAFVESSTKTNLANKLEDYEERIRYLEEAVALFAGSVDPSGEKVATAKKKAAKSAKKVEEEEAPAVEVRLSDFIGGSAAAAPVNEEAKRKALAAAR